MSVAKLAALIRRRFGWIASPVAGGFLAGVLILGGLGETVFELSARHDRQPAAASGYPVRIPLGMGYPLRFSLREGLSNQGVIAGQGVLPQETVASVESFQVGPGAKSHPTGFGEAFKDLSDHFAPIAGAKKDSSQNPRDVASNGAFIPVNFNLEGFGFARDGIKESKGVVLNGEFLGKMTLEISSSSVIYFGSGEFLRALNGKIPNKTYRNIESIAQRGGRMAFSDVRMAGIEIEYDAVKDYIVMHSS